MAGCLESNGAGAHTCSIPRSNLTQKGQYETRKSTKERLIAATPAPSAAAFAFSQTRCQQRETDELRPEQNRLTRTSRLGTSTSRLSTM